MLRGNKVQLSINYPVRFRLKQVACLFTYASDENSDFLSRWHSWRMNSIKTLMDIREINGGRNWKMTDVILNSMKL
mgnify:FL=1